MCTRSINGSPLYLGDDDDYGGYGDGARHGRGCVARLGAGAQGCIGFVSDLFSDRTCACGASWCGYHMDGRCVALFVIGICFVLAVAVFVAGCGLLWSCHGDHGAE